MNNERNIIMALLAACVALLILTYYFWASTPIIGSFQDIPEFTVTNEGALDIEAMRQSGGVEIKGE